MYFSVAKLSPLEEATSLNYQQQWSRTCQNFPHKKIPTVPSVWLNIPAPWGTCPVENWTHPTIQQLKMSVKMKDVLTAFRNNKLDRTLGLLEHPAQYRYLLTILHSWNTNYDCFRTENKLLPQTDKSYSMLRTNKSYSNESFINMARTEDGTTFYKRQQLKN